MDKDEEINLINHFALAVGCGLILSVIKNQYVAWSLIVVIETAAQFAPDSFAARLFLVDWWFSPIGWVVQLDDKVLKAGRSLSAIDQQCRSTSPGHST